MSNWWEKVTAKFVEYLRQPQSRFLSMRDRHGRWCRLSYQPNWSIPGQPWNLSWSAIRKGLFIYLGRTILIGRAILGLRKTSSLWSQMKKTSQIVGTRRRSSWSAAVGNALSRQAGVWWQMGLRTFTALSSDLKGHLMKSGEEVLFPAGGSMVFPGNNSEGYYVRFNLLAGVLLLPDVISAILVTKVEFYASR